MSTPATFLTRRLMRSAWSALLVLGLAVDGAVTAPGRGSDGPTVEPDHRDGELRYRIRGKVRMLVAWVARDDVGSARLTRRAADGRTALSLIAGSNPERAPGHLNQWVYVREDIGQSGADVFVLRSLRDAETMTTPVAPAQGDSAFGVTCTAVDATSARTALTTIAADTVLSDRSFGRLLAAMTSSKWTITRTALPSGLQPGFLSALDLALSSSSGTSTDGGDTAGGVRYIYNSTLYDMTVNERHRLTRDACSQWTSRPCERTQVSVLNRTTHTVTRFAVTAFSNASGSVIPAEIVYQPNWWLKVELRLDDAATVPSDPASDLQTQTRLRHACVSVQRARDDD